MRFTPKGPLLVALFASLAFVSAGQVLAQPSEPFPPIMPDASDPPGCRLGCLCYVGEPVNIGSGVVSTSLALFTMTELPLPVELTLSYHSFTLIPAGARRPLGEGWTHSFNMSLHPISGGRLELITAGGHHWFFTGTGPSTWMATVPAASRDRVVASGAHYVLTTQEGEQTLFDAASGRWLSTTDRWGNTIRGHYDAEGNLTSVVDPLERVFRFDYSDGLLTGIALPGEGLTWRFLYTESQLTRIDDLRRSLSMPWRTLAYVAGGGGVSHLLTEMRDELGALIEAHEYDNNARGISSIGEGGRDSFRIEYDSPSLGQTRVTHARGGVEQISVYTFDVIGGQVAPTSVDGVCGSCGLTTDTLDVAYDDEGRPIAETDGEGHVTRSTYDEASNLTSRTEAAGTPLERTTTFAYEDPGWPSFVTMTAMPASDGGTRTRRQSWNATRTVLTTTDSDGTTTHTTVSTFDARHRLSRRDGPRTDVEDVTTYTYYVDDDPEPNRRGRLSRVVNPAGHATTYDRYDLYGTARLIIDPNGVRSERETDALGRIVTVTDLPVDGDPAEAEAYVTRFAYDQNDNVIEQTLALGGRVRFAYEKGTNRLTDTILVDRDGAEFERRHLTLNAAGDVVRVEEQSCGAPAPACAAWTTRRSESYRYDGKGRLVETHRATPAGAKSVYAYDRNGKLVSVQDETHSTPNRRYAYDALGRLILESEMGLETHYGYDVQDNLVSITDRNGGASTFLYDPFGRLREERSPDSGRTTHGYDESGNRVLSTDANGVTTARTFDSLGRRLTATYSRPGETTESVGWTWDEPAPGHYGIGRRTAMTDATGTTPYAYERRGLLRAEGAVTFTYDADGNRSSIGYPSGTKVTYGYDPWGRPASALAGGSPLVTSVSYLPFGPPHEIAYGNGTRQHAGYDARYQLSSNRLDGPDGTIARYDYTRDAAGRVTGILDALDPAYDRRFVYDDLGRLIGATSGAALWSSATYAYDAMGNVHSVRVGSRRAELQYEGTTSRVKSADEGTGPRAVLHDPAGNELADGNLVRRYSLRNLMTSVEQEDAGRRIEYRYDGRGIRVAARESTLVTTPRPQRPSSPELPADELPQATRTRIVERHYVYSPELRLLGMRTGAVWTDFVWLGSIPVAQLRDGALPRFTFTDHLATPLLQTDSTARVTWHVESEPFGNTWSMRTGRAGDQPLRFPGQELAHTFGGTEERFNIFRWYRSGWGRYTQVDPMWAAAGTIYTYASADPLNLTDRTGLFSEWCMRACLNRLWDCQKQKYVPNLVSALLFCWVQCATPPIPDRLWP